MMVTAMLMTTTRRPTPPQKPAWAVAIEVRRTQLQLSQELMAERAEMSQSYYSEIERGARPLPTLTHHKLMALATALEWTLPELQQETGVFLGVPVTPLATTTEPTPIFSLKALGSSKPQPDGVNASPSGDHPQHWMQTFMDGDEMEPRIPDGFSIYFDTSKTTPERGVYVIRHAGRAYVRRYSQLPSGPAWTADNPAYALAFIPATPDVQVLGKVYRTAGIREGQALLN